MTPTIYSYYEPLEHRFDSLKLIDLWIAQWRTFGWRPFVLNEYIARQHPLFAKFDELVCRLPSLNPAHERACFLRWLALAVMGGGWLADYDVFPRCPWDTQCDPGKITLFQKPACPCLSYCLPDLVGEFMEAVMTHNYGRRTINDKEHYSDQSCFEDLLSMPWLEVRDVVKLRSKAGWETAPVVHYDSSFVRTPRWQYVESLAQSQSTVIHQTT